MTDKRKTPSGGNREGLDSFLSSKLTKPKNQPQEPILHEARKEALTRYHENPTPINLVILKSVSAQWKAAFIREVCQ